MQNNVIFTSTEITGVHQAVCSSFQSTFTPVELLLLSLIYFDMSCLVRQCIPVLYKNDKKRTLKFLIQNG